MLEGLSDKYEFKICINTATHTHTQDYPKTHFGFEFNFRNTFHSNTFEMIELNLKLLNETNTFSYKFFTHTNPFLFPFL